MSIKKNLIYNLILQLTNILFPLITIPYVSRILGVENMGLVNFINTYVNYVALFAVLGIGYYGIREVAKVRDDREKINLLFSELFFFICLSTVCTSVLYVLSILFIPQLSEYWQYYLLAGMTLYFSPLSFNWYFSGIEDFKVITVRSVVIRLISFVALFLFVRERNDVMWYLIIMVFSTVGADIWNIIYARMNGLRLIHKHLNIRRHCRPMFIFFLSTFATSIFVTLDVLMLGFLSDYSEVGYFTSANRLVLIMLAAFTAINTVLLPRLSFNREKNDEAANKMLLQKAFDISAFIMAPATIGLFLCSYTLVPLFFGHEFLGSIVPLQILALKLIIVMLNSFFVSNILVVSCLEKEILYIVFITAIVSVILNFFFIPRWGANGAAITSVFAEGIEAIMNIYVVYKYTEVRVQWRKFWTSFLYVLPIILLYFLFNKYIVNPFYFLSAFVISSILVYSLMQWCWGREQWMKEFICLIKLDKVLLNK